MMVVLISIYQAICIFRSNWNGDRFSKITYAYNTFYVFVSIFLFLLFFPINWSVVVLFHAIQPCVLIIVDCRTTTATKHGM
jgi:hypothetical protein